MWKRYLITLAVGQTEDGRWWLALCAFLALLAGCARAVMHRTAQTKAIDIIAGGVACSLAGFGVCAMVLWKWGPAAAYPACAAGIVSAWVGIPLLDMAGQRAMAVLAAKTGADTETANKALAARLTRTAGDALKDQQP